MDLNNSLGYKKFLNKNLLAVDFGEINLGLAKFTPGDDPFILGLPNIKGPRKNAHWSKDLIKICQEEDIEIIIWGQPTFADGKTSPLQEQIKAHAEDFSKTTRNLKTYFADEYLSSFEAKDRLSQVSKKNLTKDMIDTESAKIILETFLLNFKDD